MVAQVEDITIDGGLTAAAANIAQISICAGLSEFLCEAGYPS